MGVHEFQNCRLVFTPTAQLHRNIRQRLHRAIVFSERFDLEDAIRDFQDNLVADKRNELMKGCRELDVIKTTDCKLP